MGKVVSEEEKDRIMANEDDDAAFDAFISVYDDIEPEGFRSSTSPEDLAKERTRQKRIFVKNVQMIREHNKRYARGEVSYKMVVNSFAVMDEDNRRMFLGLGKDSIYRRPTTRTSYGLGSSRYQPDYRVEREGGLFNASSASGLMGVGVGSTRAQTSLDWRSKLGPIKDQQTCGSCWTFPATALLEFAIQKTTGQKLPLSEQQLLDCTYESQNYDACRGGWYYQAWDYIIKNNNKLASQSDYRYKNADGACYDSYYSNALSGKIKLNSYHKIPASQILDKMQVTPLAVAFFVDNAFYSIGSGTFDGCYTYYPSNHAVTLTGYGSNYWEIRNSWGADWGNRGYGRFRRSGTRNICNLLSDAYAISYSRSDGRDDDDDRDDDRDDRGGDCTDNAQHAANCGGWADTGYCEGGQYADWMQQNCKKSCGACRDVEPEPDNDCTDTRSEAECREWEENYNYCTQGDYIDWMRENCAKTCRSCDREEEEREEEEVTCEDNREYADACSGWKDQGFCRKGNEYFDWMSGNCAKTCDTCEREEEEEVDPTERSSGDCEDNHTKCKKWAKAGYCDNRDYTDYMRTNCQSSCDSCEEVEPTERTEEPTDPTAQLIPHSKVSQSTTQKVKKKLMVADLAVDGDESTRSQTKCSGKKDAWFKYKFEEESRVSTVEILNGNFDKKRAKLNGAIVYVQEVEGLKKKCGEIVVRDSSSKADQTYSVDCDGTYASGIEILQRTKYKGKKCLELKEVRVYGFAGEDSTASSGSSEPTVEPTEEGEEERDDNDGCPGGTVRCPDGICKHIHMCGRG